MFVLQKPDDAPSDGQTCLGCSATSTPEWRRGPMGRCFCRAFSLPFINLTNLLRTSQARGRCATHADWSTPKWYAYAPSPIFSFPPLTFPLPFAQIKKRYKEKAANPKKLAGASGAAKRGHGNGNGNGNGNGAVGMTSVLSSSAGVLHVIAQNDSEDDGSDEDDDYNSQGRRSDRAD